MTYSVAVVASHTGWTTPTGTAGVGRCRRPNRELLAVGIVAIGYVAARVIPMIGATTIILDDTHDYVASSRNGLSTRSFWAGSRPPLYPLLIKLFGRSNTLLFVFQASVAIAAWLALAWLLYTRLHPRVVGTTTALTVLFASLALEVVQWDRVLLTESLTMSLGVLLIVLSWRFCETPSRGRGTALVAAALAWVLLRDSNGYAVACFAVAFVIAAIASRTRRAAFVAVAVAFVAVSAIGGVSSSIGRRWEGPLKDVITIRFLKDPHRADYLIAHGYPMSRAEISRVAGHCVVPSNSRSCVLVTDPRFYAWIRVDGRSVYEHWLLSHPTTALSDPVRNSGQLLGHRLRVDHFSHYRFALASLAEDVFFVRNQRMLLAEAFVALGLAIRAVRRRPSPLPWIVLTALASTYPHIFVIWSFGALETERHALAASLILRLALILAVACVVSDTRCRPAPTHGTARSKVNTDTVRTMKAPVPTRGTGAL